LLSLYTFFFFLQNPNKRVQEGDIGRVIFIFGRLQRKIGGTKTYYDKCETTGAQKDQLITLTNAHENQLFELSLSVIRAKDLIVGQNCKYQLQISKVL